MAKLIRIGSEIMVDFAIPKKAMRQYFIASDELTVDVRRLRRAVRRSARLVVAPIPDIQAWWQAKRRRVAQACSARI
jgi:predicted ATPase